MIEYKALNIYTIKAKHTQHPKQNSKRKDETNESKNNQSFWHSTLYLAPNNCQTTKSTKEYITCPQYSIGGLVNMVIVLFFGDYMNIQINITVIGTR